MKEAEKELLGDKSRRRFFRHVCDASITGVFEYDREERWNRDVRSGYLRSEAIGQSRLRVLNVSEGGIALVSRFPVLKSAVVSLRISTAFNTTIQMKARARWSKKLKTSGEAYAVGLEFLEMSRGDARNLKELLNVLQRQSSEQRTSTDQH